MRGEFVEDQRIVELYWERNEKALEESQAKYGAYLRTLAGNILQNQEDGAECVNDTWLRAWNSIPPERPLDLRLYLARIARNLAIDRFRRSAAKKRGGGETQALLSELSGALPDASRDVEAKELSESINAFIRALPRREGDILIRRYFFAERVDAIAKRYRMSANAVSASLARSRKKLAAHLKRRVFLNNYDILMAFSGVDDDLLRRSGERPQPRKIIARWAAMAASFALVIAAGFGLRAAFSHVRQPSGLLFNTIIESGSSEPSMKEDAFYEEMTEDELAAALPVYQSDLLSSATGTVEYLAQSGELSELWMRVFLQSWDRQINVRVSPNKPGMDLGCIAPVNEEIRSSHLGFLTYTAYRFEWEDRVELWVDFQIGDAYYRMSTFVADKEEAAGRALYELLASYEGRLREGVTLDLGAYHMREEHEYIKRTDLTISEARGDETFGVYFPASSPQGLELKYSERYKFQTEDWLKGQWKSPRAGASNYLEWRIGWYGDKHYAFSSPIFKIEELSLQAILSRACYADDKMTFGVLYGDILVTVNAKGVDPQWIYETLIGLG